MNQLLIYPEEILDSKKVKLVDPDRLDHLKKVLKLKTGARIRVCIVDVGVGTATILDLQESECVLEIEKINSGLSPWCTLYVGLCRPPTLQKIFEHGTCMGIRSFHIVQAHLSEKSYWDSRLFRQKGFEKYFKLGLAQSNSYYRIPSLHRHYHLKNLSFEEDGQKKLLLDPGGCQLISDQDFPARENVTLCIGPERGWTEAEVLTLDSQGFQPVKVSSSLLRVEHALFHALAQLELIRLQEVNK